MEGVNEGRAKKRGALIMLVVGFEPKRKSSCTALATTLHGMIRGKQIKLL